MGFSAMTAVSTVLTDLLAPSDSLEIAQGNDPYFVGEMPKNVTDTDSDGASDSLESHQGTDVTQSQDYVHQTVDSDGDGVSDSLEQANGSHYSDAIDIPNNKVDGDQDASSDSLEAPHSAVPPTTTSYDYSHDGVVTVVHVDSGTYETYEYNGETGQIGNITESGTLADSATGGHDAVVFDASNPVTSSYDYSEGSVTIDHSDGTYETYQYDADTGHFGNIIESGTLLDTGSQSHEPLLFDTTHPC